MPISICRASCLTRSSRTSRFPRLSHRIPRWLPVAILAGAGIVGCAQPATSASAQDVTPGDDSAAPRQAAPRCPRRRMRPRPIRWSFTAGAPEDQDRDPAACLASLRASAPANGISVADFDRYTRTPRLLAVTVAAAKAQPEGKETWWDYIAKTVDDQRVAEGKAVLAKSHDALAAIDARYQTDSEPLVAIFGIETNYGSQLGKVDVLNAWLTRACTEQKPLWVKNVYASVRLAARRHRHARAFHRFVERCLRHDAVHSDVLLRIGGRWRRRRPDRLCTARCRTRWRPRRITWLKRKATWTRGMPAVIEVRLPASMAATLPPSPDNEIMNRDDRRPLSQWRDAGVTRADGTPLSGVAMSQPWNPCRPIYPRPPGRKGRPSWPRAISMRSCTVNAAVSTHGPAVAC